MRKVLGSAAALLTALVLLALPGCQPKPRTDGLGPPGIVRCGSEAVGKHAIDALPGINQCLAGEGDVMACILGLVQPAAGILVDTVLCVTSHEGAAARAAATGNPFDERDRRRAARAEEFLGKMRDRGWAVQE
jgi:hypothetical protein